MVESVRGKTGEIEKKGHGHNGALCLYSAKSASHCLWFPASRQAFVSDFSFGDEMASKKKFEAGDVMDKDKPF